MTAYAMKVGDDDPDLRIRCYGPDGLPADLTGVTDIAIGFRHMGEGMPILERAAVLDTIGTTGIVKVVWADGESEILGPGDIEFDIRVVRASGRPTRFPSEGYGVFRVWKPITQEPGS